MKKKQVLSKAADLKDQVIGSLKENLGYMIGNKDLENQGKHQKESAGYDIYKTNIAEKATTAKDQVVGTIKENVDQVTGKDSTLDKDKIAEKAATAKDQVVGTIKENVDQATGKDSTLDKDDAQKAATANYQAVGIKDNVDQATGKDSTLDKDKVAEKASKVKEQVVGKVKETVGNMSGNETMVDEGKKRQANAEKNSKKGTSQK